MSENLQAAPPRPETSSPTAGPERRRSRYGAAVWTGRLVVLVVAIGGWELFARLQIVDPFFYGQPSQVVDQIVTWVQSGTAQGSLWAQIGVTMEETVLGWVIGVVFGVVFGVALGRIRFLSDVLGPYIKIMNSIPRIVLGSIFIVAFGLGLGSKVLLAVVLVFFAVFFNAFQGTREVDRNLMANARILGASRWRVTRDVVLPSAFTWIIASLHVSFGFALIGAIVGEFLGAQQGLGLLIRTAQGTFNANGVLAAMVIVAVVALIAEGLITAVEKKVLRWRPPALSGPDL
ncbi:ABC transporter permease [Pseudonocardia acidicola]|uniref:ABC transporter permease n=1 Tax=Pseudonocardia acidicola TaxID=2724939 RepID=A0ABX1SKK1_9PSEU|nr:ABC transporter permease [Pseudonocardia acidicola]NMI00922.1 ABC transporter permease [Pseudonocardia acidicola]